VAEGPRESAGLLFVRTYWFPHVVAVCFFQKPVLESPQGRKVLVLAKFAWVTGPVNHLENEVRTTNLTTLRRGHVH
jgi:hypothetical protein